VSGVLESAKVKGIFRCASVIGLSQASPMPTGYVTGLCHRFLLQTSVTGICHKPLSQVSLTSLCYRFLWQASVTGFCHKPRSHVSVTGFCHRQCK